MTTIHDTTDDAFEPGHRSSSTARVIEELELYGYPGSGITGNLADKAKCLGIPVLDHREGGA